MSNLQRLNTTHPDFWPRLEALTAWEGVADDAVTATVRDILAQVRQRGDDALLEYTRRFDRRDIEHAAALIATSFLKQEALQTKSLAIARGFLIQASLLHSARPFNL